MTLDPFGRAGGMVNVRFSFGRFKSVYFILDNVGGYFFDPLKLLMKVPRAGITFMNQKSILTYLGSVIMRLTKPILGGFSGLFCQPRRVVQ